MPTRLRTLLFNVSFSAACVSAVLATSVIATNAAAQDLAGAPERPPSSMREGPGERGPGMYDGRDRREMVEHHDRRQGFARQGRPEILPSLPAHPRPGACYARVKTGPEPGPPTGDREDVWTQQPGPPGSLGPIWRLSRERYGWVRVLCAEDVRPRRFRDMQPRLHADDGDEGLRDDHSDGVPTFRANRFRAERHIEHHGYLSIQAVQTVGPPPPCPERRRPHPAGPGPTTFETGYIVWPGKVRF